MSQVFIVNGTPYQFPDPGENPNWAEGVTNWAQGVTEALSTLLAIGDILETEFTVSNNVSSPSDINGLLFDTGIIRSVEITYNIYRTSNDVISGKAETGKMLMVYDDNAVPTEKWSVVQTRVGDAGVVLSVLDSGQLQYVSSNLTGINYFGLIKFSAKVLGKA